MDRIAEAVIMKSESDDKYELFDQITVHLIEDNHPSEFINCISTQHIFKQFPFFMLDKLKSTEQSKQHHPEGNVWNHTMLVVDEAAKVREQSKDNKVFMWAALLHDIGKPDTTRIRKGKITSYDHDAVGTKLCINFLSAITDDKQFITDVSILVKYHMHILYILKGLPYGDIKGLLQEADIYDIALLSRCDRFGRTGVDKEEEIKQYKNYLRILESKQK